MLAILFGLDKCGEIVMKIIFIVALSILMAGCAQKAVTDQNTATARECVVPDVGDCKGCSVQCKSNEYATCNAPRVSSSYYGKSRCTESKCKCNKYGKTGATGYGG